MMNPIVEENLISFKVLEHKIYAYVCELGREVTQITLEPYMAALNSSFLYPDTNALKKKNDAFSSL